MAFWVKLGIMFACTLAGGKTKPLDTPQGQNCTAPWNFPHCQTLDETVTMEDLRMPWIICVCTIVVMGAPTLFLQSNKRGGGISLLVEALVRALVLIYSSMHLPYKIIVYTVGLYGSVSVLTGFKASRSLVGYSIWYFRYLSVSAIVAVIAYNGPPVSVVTWPGNHESNTICALVAHLLGFIIPEMFLDTLDMLKSTAGFLSYART